MPFLELPNGEFLPPSRKLVNSLGCPLCSLYALLFNEIGLWACVPAKGECAVKLAQADLGFLVDGEEPIPRQ